MSITLNNESGELLVPKEPVANYLEYIEEGEGTWSITTEGSHGGKKTYSSADNIDTVEISVPEERIPVQERQLELETGQSASDHKISDATMVAQISAEVEKYSER